MNLPIHLIQQMEDDIDLLVRSDEWLEAERKSSLTKLEEQIKEVRAIQLAQKIKKQLQQNNLTVVRNLIKSEEGEIVDIVLRIMNINDAMDSLQYSNSYDQSNSEEQISNWQSDGYEINN